MNELPYVVAFQGHFCCWHIYGNSMVSRICSLFKELNFLWNRTIFPGTQAFASPPDMASSGVWENIILYKTLTIDGVCGMLYYII